MRVFRVQYPARDGRRQRQSSKWYVEVRVHGVPYKVSAFTDRAASLELGKKLQRLADLAGSREQPPADLTSWAAGLEPKLQERLVTLGIVPASRVAGGRELRERLDEYAAVLGARNRAGQYVQNVRSHVERVLAALGWRVFADMDGAALERWL
ncbi:MAG: hypothetical protein ABL998_23495, partial [Planctomycetota bacterium]